MASLLVLLLSASFLSSPLPGDTHSTHQEREGGVDHGRPTFLRLRVCLFSLETVAGSS